MSTLVHSFFVTDVIELAFQVSEFRGIYYGDVRQYVHSSRYMGPTKHGLTFSLLQLEQFISAIENNRRILLDSKVEEQIEKIPYKKDSSIVISLVESNLDNNPVCLDIREYLQSHAYTGFTPKGIRIPINLLEAFIEGCRLLKEKIDDKATKGKSSSINEKDV
jgi:hypothetical protein